MNLYKITAQHFAPKGSMKAIICFLMANNDEQVFDWLGSQPSIDGQMIGLCYEDYALEPDLENDPEETEGLQKPVIFPLYGADYTETGTETFKERIIRCKGEMFDPENEDYISFDGAYYGLDLYGWVLAEENLENPIALEKLGILYWA